MIGCLARNFSKDCITAFAFDHADDRLLVALADYGVEFPEADLTPGFDMRGPIGNWPASNELPPTVSAARIAFTLLLLTTKVLPERTTRAFVRLDITINRLVAHPGMRSDLLGAPFDPEQLFGLRTFTCVDASRVTRILASEFRKALRLLRPISSEPGVPLELTPDCRPTSAKYLGNTGNSKSVQKSVDLVMFVPTEMFVGHCASSTGRSRKLRYSKNLSHLNHLNEVALRI